ncbi:MAG: M20/M25/M40 family metallo-hydrolase [Clostridiales bacterium]|nr:M20/M25/M40 family metallo-hydrolase [Clostridiales bacterium]
MKLSDLDINQAAKIRESTNFTVREVKKVCKNIGPRASGTENEDKAQEFVIENCSKFADTVEKETFGLSPRAFMAWPWVCALFMLIAAAFYQLSAFDVVPSCSKIFNIAALALTVIAVIIIVFDFLLYKKILDPFFKKATSSNVILTKKPVGEVKRRIIFSGHIDSSYEWRFTHLGGAKLVTAVIAAAIVSVGVSLVIYILSLVTEPSSIALWFFKIVDIVAALVCMVGFFFENGKVVVDGANDDLTGVYSSIAVLQFMTDNNIRFENTEVVAISMGAEEPGLRGSKAYVKKHADELNKVETVFVETDTLRDMEFMGVFNKDMTGTVKLDSKAVELVKKAASMADKDLPYLSCFFGSSDAAAMAQGGVKSVLFAAMDPAPARYYHTRLDTADNLDIKTVEKGVEILINTALLFDEQGLKEKYD